MVALTICISVATCQWAPGGPRLVVWENRKLHQEEGTKAIVCTCDLTEILRLIIWNLQGLSRSWIQARSVWFQPCTRSQEYRLHYLPFMGWKVSTCQCVDLPCTHVTIIMKKWAALTPKCISWGIYNPANKSSISSALSYATDYLSSRSKWAKDIKKPIIMEEFGMVTDDITLSVWLH